ncbi:hypothetical protein [Pseudomonas fluorescens]|uniref:hypothetical protein n=1 Tax=Pseudomonas fluorescens TaxID=294 RepID=UPI000CA24D88|nr:hypothetical protein [Pseudomonas fluorescens]AUM71224.1 hypothetical protein C0J56_21800 [Pseudomonas fluorescens]
MPTNTLGINIAAVTGFPKGLLVEIPPWDDNVMSKGDSVNLRLDANVVDSGAIIDDADVGKPVRLFIPAAQLLTGSYRVDYVVTRPGVDPEPSPATPIYVKIERPGGQDQNGSAPGHSELIMEIPEEFELGGVDADTPFVPITIKGYPEIKEGDRIFLSWAGVYVEHPVTAEQAEDPDAHPIVITVDKATIDAGGDADELPVAFFVRDVVNNDSEDWSAEARLAVNTGNSRLAPPLVKETDNNVLDMDNLPDSDTVTAQVVAYGSDFAVGDEIEIRLKGTTADGEAVDKTYPLVPIMSTNKIVDIPLPSADVRPLVNTQVVFSFRLVKANGTDDLFSKGLFVRVIGEAQRLKAPIAKDAIAGTLDPALLHTIIQIPWDDSMAAGQVIELQWFGTRANGSTYFPTLNPHPISNGEGQAKLPIDIPVNGEHLRPIDGGTLELFYLLFRDTDARDIVRRESLHAELLSIGEPVAKLPKPVVEGEQDEILDPADKPLGTRLIVLQYDDQTSGDEVHYAWVGSKSGVKSDYVTLNSLTDDDDVPFDIAFNLIKENEGGTVKASYWVKHKAGGISPSEVLSMSIGPAMDLMAPSVKEATGTAPVQQLNPVAATAALTVVIPEYGIKPDDQVSVTWAGAPGEGSYTVPAQTLPTSREISIPVSVIAYNLGKPVTVTYSVTRNGGDSPPSASLNLAVQTLAPGDLLNSKPKISQAENNGEGPELDLNDLTDGGTVRIEGWPHIAVGQYVWLRLKGTKADGSNHDLTIWQPPSRVTSDEYDRNYLQVTAPYEYLKDLAEGSTLTVEFKVAFGWSSDEALAETFPLRTYTVRAVLELFAPSVKEATGTAPNQQLNPVAAEDNLTVVIPDYGVQPGDQVSVTWTGTPGAGTYISPIQVLPTNREIAMPVSVIAYNLGKPVTVTYIVTRNNEPRPPSDALTLVLQAMPAEALEPSRPRILQAAQNGNDTELDMNGMSGDATVRIDSWPHVAHGQRVWIGVEGTKIDGSNYVKRWLGTGNWVSAEWYRQGYGEVAIPYADLRGLRDGSTLKLTFKASFNQSTDENQATTFPPRAYTIRAAMDLSAPRVKQASGAAPSQQLNPVAAKDALTVVLPEYGVQPGDQVRVTWAGTAGGGSHTTPAQALPSNREIDIPVEVLAYNLGKPVTVTYTVTRNGETSDPSAALNLAVQTIAPGDLLGAKPKILQAANNGDGSELDLNTISTNATCWLGTWPLIAEDQDVWLRIKGTKADGTVPYDLDIWAPPPQGPKVTPAWISQGFYEIPALYSYLKDLKDGSDLTMEFKVDFSETTDEANAITFPLRSYTVVRVPLLVHYTPFTNGELNSWALGSGGVIRDEDGNDYCQTTVITLNPSPLCSGKRYEVSVRARSAQSGVKLDFWLVPGSLPVDSHPLSSQWQTYRYVFEGPSPHGSLMFYVALPSTVDIDDIRIYQL